MLDVKKDRARYAAAALTIVQAFLCAGAPPQAEPLGFFEKWSLYVRDALIWLGCADACETMEAIRADDPKRNDLARLMKAWWGLFHSEPHTVREAINNAMLEYDGALAHPDLNDALMQVARARAGGGLDGLRLSGWLRRHKRVVTGGKYFDRDPLDDDWGAARWALLEGSAPKDASRDDARRASDVSDASDVFYTHARKSGESFEEERKEDQHTKYRTFYIRGLDETSGTSETSKKISSKTDANRAERLFGALEKSSAEKSGARRWRGDCARWQKVCSAT